MQDVVTSARAKPAPAGARPEHPGLDLVLPGAGYVGAAESFASWLGVPGATLTDLGSLPGGAAGHQLVALRYIVANLETWASRFVWKPSLKASLKRRVKDLSQEGVELLLEKAQHLKDQVLRVRRAAVGPTDATFDAWLDGLPHLLDKVDEPTDELIHLLWTLETQPERVAQARAWLRKVAPEAYGEKDTLLDQCYLAVFDLHTYPATTAPLGHLRHVIIADKGEMGCRAVREVVALGKTPVVLHSIQDDNNSLQVRLAKEHKGLTVGLVGNFRESYANFIQIAAKVKEAYRAHFKAAWADELAHSGLYPGYGPLAENAAAIRHFRREGLIFVGPMQDVVEKAGDKRMFRRMAASFNPKAVTPGIIIDANDAATIQKAVEDGFKRKDFTFPGRLKAANGGGGRGQVVLQKVEDVPAGIQKVLGEINSYGWDAGVMFEQNIPETIHLEVQVVRDRYGNTRHFGMRDCTEQRASQKIQEEAPPALLQKHPGLEDAITSVAVKIADAAGYCGAGTVELMFKDGKFYFLEMNTRIQVEHPVTEETRAIIRNGALEKLNLVRLQMLIAEGAPIDFTQEQVVATHVGREFRINAESWNAELKDARDGGRGLFVPAAGIFDEIALPETAAILALFGNDLHDLRIRFDCGFEAGDVLVNKDPTFGKLLVSVSAKDPTKAYELLRQVSREVLKRLVIRGRGVMPDGRIIPNSEFKTNIPEHIKILDLPIMKQHCKGDETGRHVNWVVKALREATLTQ
jgi:acetyl/propionyl-CoA carboxylase alpha subunit